MHVDVDRGLRGPDSISWRALLLLLGVVCVDTCAHLLLKSGIERADIANMPGAVPFPVAMPFPIVNALLSEILKAALEPRVWIATFMIMGSFLLWSRALSLVDLSVAVPVISLNLATVPVGASLLLGEDITPKRWLGISLIVTGVIVSSLTRYKPGTHPPTPSPRDTLLAERGA